MGDRVGADRRATSFQLIPAAVTERLAVGGWLLNSRAILHPALAPPVVKFDGRRAWEEITVVWFSSATVPDFVCVCVCSSACASVCLYRVSWTVCIREECVEDQREFRGRLCYLDSYYTSKSSQFDQDNFTLVTMNILSL